MRLIDADAEIAKIEQEIQRINEKIKRLENRMWEDPNNNIYVFSEQIRQCHRNIANCNREIRVLRQYPTAYDVDKVVEELEEIAIEFETFGQCSDYVELSHAIENVKAGSRRVQQRMDSMQ